MSITMKFEVTTLPVADVERERRTYLSRASFADPNGNRRVLQEVTDRLPGRV